MKMAVNFLSNELERLCSRAGIHLSWAMMDDLLNDAKKIEQKNKLRHELFVGKVSEIIGFEKTVQLLKECNETFKSE